MYFISTIALFINIVNDAIIKGERYGINYYFKNLFNIYDQLNEAVIQRQ